MGLGCAVQAAVEVGEVTYSHGLLTGQIDGEDPRIIGKGVALHNGETLNTGDRAFAVIELDDGTRMTLRPNTTFKIEDVDLRQGNENALLSLIRGGLRALTGAISKARANVFRINTTVATIGIRGTEFDLRLCESDECQAEEDAAGQAATRESRVVARVALLRGSVSAREDGRQSRVLGVGAAVYERDQIETGRGSFAVIAFNDQSRVTLSPDSAMRIEEHEFKPQQPDENNAFMRFLRGGMRLVTGLVGQLNPRSFRVGTPTATIGIRGTGFDLVCQGACVDENALLDPAGDTLIARLFNLLLRPAYAQTPPSGMYAKAWQGSILLYLSGETRLLQNGRSAFLRNNFSTPQPVADIPPQLRNFQGAPRPDRIDVPADFFKEVGATEIEPGLYVKVDDGDVSVQGADGNTLHVGAGETVRAGRLAAVRLAFVPAFQKLEVYPSPAQVTRRMQMRMDLFGAEGADEEAMECTVR
jgi:hypothetical protein